MSDGAPLPAESPPPPPLPPTAELAWRRFVPVIWLMALLIGSSIAAGVAVQVTGDDSPRIDLCMVLFDTLVVGLFVVREWPAVRRALTLRGIGAVGWGYAAVVLLVLGLFMEGYMWGVTLLFEQIELLAPFRQHGWPAWSAVLMIVVAPAVVEELAFRGFLLERLEPLIGSRDALLLQATLFSIVHLAIPNLLSHFVLGLGIGMVRQKTGSLIPCMCVHGTWNAIVLVQEGLLRS